jgi:hypothetical protein
MSANSVIATPSSRLKLSRLTANPLLEVRHMMPQGSDCRTASHHRQILLIFNPLISILNRQRAAVPRGLVLPRETAARLHPFVRY